jgi:hypothetical protein
VTDVIEVSGLVVAVAALISAVFPIRAYLLERFRPFEVSFIEAPRRFLKPTQYRIELTIRNRTDRTTYFGLAFENLPTEPPNFPDLSITRMVNGDVASRGSFPVGPNETDGWVIFLDFELPIDSPATLLFFSRNPEVRESPSGNSHRREYRHVLQPVPPSR